MLVIGLTGGIGSGKSTVAELFAKHDIPIIDADIIAKNITLPGTSAFSSIVHHFGPSILQNDGMINRAQLRQIIFSDTTQRLWLERLLHPIILEEIQRQIVHTKAPYCITVIPLLFEIEPVSFIDRILVIDTPEALQIKRVMLRDHASQHAIEGILKTQANRELRLTKAHDVITNDGTVDALIHQVDRLHTHYLKLSQKSEG